MICLHDLEDDTPVYRLHLQVTDRAWSGPCVLKADGVKRPCPFRISLEGSVVDPALPILDPRVTTCSQILVSRDYARGIRIPLGDTANVDLIRQWSLVQRQCNVVVGGPHVPTRDGKLQLALRDG